MFLFSAGKILFIAWGYHQASRLYSEAEEAYVAPEQDDTGFSVDFPALKAVNPEVIGWLVIDDTAISYPIVRGTDNDKYLKTAYDGSPSRNGSIFMNCYNAADFSDQNTLIYGHHMRDGSMFGKLPDFKDPAFLQSHRTFSIYVEGGELRYEIFAAYETYSASFVYTDHFNYSWDFYEFAQKCRNASIIDLGVELTENDHIVTLSTCNSRNNRASRFVVQGKRITE